MCEETERNSDVEQTAETHGGRERWARREDKSYRLTFKDV